MTRRFAIGLGLLVLTGCAQNAPVADSGRDSFRVDRLTAAEATDFKGSASEYAGLRRVEGQEDFLMPLNR